jgi:hypothetical protein
MNLAIMCILYLYPFYNTTQELQDLRFDEDFMQDELDRERLLEYTDKFKSRALERRVKTMLKAYDL